MQRDYGEYSGARNGPNETRREAGDNGGSLEELIEQEFLCDQDANTEDVTDGALASARKLVQAVGRAVPVAKKGYVKLIRNLANDLQTVHRGAEVTREKLAERKAKFGELDLNVQLLAEEAGRADDLQKPSGSQSSGAQVGQERVGVREISIEGKES